MGPRFDGAVRTAAAALAALAIGGAAAGQSTVRASLDGTGQQGNSTSELSRLSGNGRFVAFVSAADNLITKDANGALDVFVRDLEKQTIERVSVSTAGLESNGDSIACDISQDGRFVAFESKADNLVAGDKNGVADVFVRDRKSGTTFRVSEDATGREGNGRSGVPSLSSDGRFVAFVSRADNLVPGDTNGTQDAFVKDRKSGTIERVSIDSTGAEADGWTGEVRISGDGTRVAMLSSATNLVLGDTNGKDDVFLRDRAAGTTTRISLAPGGAEPDDACFLIALSGDGSTVAFSSLATNLVAIDLNHTSDVFVVDVATSSIECVSVDSRGVVGDQWSAGPALSLDGRYVAFGSFADDLVFPDTNGAWDVFVRDRRNSLTWRASLATSGAEGDDYSDSPDLDDSGRIVSFESAATNLVVKDTNGVEDVFVRTEAPAAWVNYDAGYPGTLGVPAFVVAGDPTLGTTLQVDLDNSLGVDTVGLIFIGFDKASQATTAGGTLLVALQIAFPCSVPAAGLHLKDAIDDDEALCGFEVYLQALELDAGAAHGISFSAGLELLLGR